MTDSAGPRRPPLRVAIFAEDEGPFDWAAALAPGQPVEFVHGRDHLETAVISADLVVICAPLAKATELAARLGEAAKAPPLAILTGASGPDHPQARLMKALLQAKREWEAAVDALQEPLAILDRDGRVARANLAFARTFGLPIRDVLGRPVADILGAALGQDPIALSLADGAPRIVEAQYSCVKAPHQFSLSPLRGGEGERGGGLVLLLKDLTEQKEQQERLLHSARLADVGQLAAGVAHEINTPLASIGLRAESLRRSARDPAIAEHPAGKNFARYLETIEQEVFRCKKIIRALLEFSAHTKPQKKATDLNRLAEGAADLVQHQLRIKGVLLERRFADPLPLVSADDGQLRQVVLALIVNALDATPAGGRIAVETRVASGGFVSLVISDNGQGIPKEIQDKIFNPFFTTKPLGQGTGLGLSVCHGIVSSHGGHIRVESEVGQGTRMEILLPARTHDEEVAS